MACHNYDQSLDILYSEEHNFKVEFDYKIEPGVVRVFDFQVDKTDTDIKISMATSRDGSFFMNTARIDISKDKDHYLEKFHQNAH